MPLDCLELAFQIPRVILYGEKLSNNPKLSDITRSEIFGCS